MERTNLNTPKYAVNVTHHGLHLLFMAFDLAMSIVQNDVQDSERLIEMFAQTVQGSPARVTSAIVTRRAVTAAHREAVAVDGHGTEFWPAPLDGEAFADAMSGFDERLRKYDAAIAGSIAREAVDGTIPGDVEPTGDEWKQGKN